jgi:Holliday junction resolvasome RuvABC endonuclease subunit
MGLKVFQDGVVAKGPVWIGIDQSYSGFALTALGDNGYYTEVYSSDKRGTDRLRDIQAHVMDWMHEFDDIRDVSMEGYAYGATGRVFNLGELGGMVKLTLLEFGVYPLIVPPTSLKKYIAGKATGVSKSQVLLHTYKTFGVEFTDDNAADSYVLAHIVKGTAKYNYQQEVITKLNSPEFRER